tara:strand:- start:2253 stop:3263 length:1011 start_codon:yes stop_codon:yes gene_type:complete
MIIKAFEIDKKNISKFKVFIVYGENEGLKKEIISKIKRDHGGKEIKYDEDLILKNTTEFYSQIKNNSLFEEKKIFLLERCTDKISEIVMEICEDITEDLIIVNCGILEKKSKLRKIIEDSQNAVIIPTYKDNSQSLANIAKALFNEKKINISHETLNLLVSRCNGDRGYLKHELEKISNYLSDKKNISLKEITTLTNLFENYSASELVDASLSKNMKKTCEILDENNYSNEHIFLILRVFLQKTKKLLNLIENLNIGKNVEKAISEYRPPIFWKDKPIIERQLQIWSFEGVKNLIYKINDVETKIKKDNSLSLILMKNFIYEIISNKTNNSSLLTQ